MVGFKSAALFFGAFLPAAFSAPVVSPRAAQVIPGKYIVTLKKDASPAAVSNHLAWVGDVHTRSLGRRDESGVDKVFEMSNFKAYAGTFDAQTIATIKASEDVS